VNLSYANVWKRLAASLIDTALLSLFAGLGWLLDIISSWDDLLGFSPILLLLSWLYFALLESSPMQATLGKKLLGIQVGDLDGEQISFVAATIRYFSKSISSALFCAGYIMAFFTEKHQALHDIIAKTVVFDVTVVSMPSPVQAATAAYSVSPSSGETPLFSPGAEPDPGDPLAGFGKAAKPKEDLFVPQDNDPKWLTSFGEMKNDGGQEFSELPGGESMPPPPVQTQPRGTKQCPSCGTTVGQHQTMCHKCKAVLKKEKGKFW
jgi:uncharacterized RDD family membrane protein YckC